MSQDVLAVVAGHEITELELEAFVASLPREQQMYASNPQFRQQCMEQLTALHMFAELGAEEKLDETEEYRKIMESARRDVLAQLAIREVMKKVTLTEEEMQAYYEEHKQQYTKGEGVTASHILVKDEEECNAILAAIKAGEKSFEDAAKESSTCPSGAKGGDLGEFSRGQMVKEFEDAAFDAEIGEIVGPVQTQFGYHIIKTTAKREAGLLPFEEVKGQIRGIMGGMKQSEAYDAKLKELREKYL